MPLTSEDLTIRPLQREDAAVLAALELRCVGAACWGEAGYRDIGGGSGVGGWAAERGSTVLGFILVRAVADEMEVLNLAVDPDARRQGIAARLLARVIEVQRADVKRVYLEVRESNTGARGFYSSAGFAEQGRRKNYYSQPVEDALLLVLHLH